MTSNQISYAAVAETARHNTVTEAETERHNKATEDLTSEANAINADKNRITETYNTQTYTLQKQYNEWYAKYSEATTEKKLQLEAEGNAIKQQLADVDQAYKLRMSEINSIQADIASRKQKEDARHNAANEQLTRESLNNEWWYKNWELYEKSRANDLTDTYNRQTYENVRRGQDLTFDSNVISALVKSGLDLSIPGFKVGIKGLGPMTTLELFNAIIGDRYGSKEEPESGKEALTTGSGQEAISGKLLKSEERQDVPGTGKAIQGRLR